ncbi:MAG: electron transfer flavoprotein subunit alpha/FixB family protein, partial [Rhodospirillaceae bacterium]|nr:electron transfer flavoprotein subunit alpha/FixB family protein [Rhodospirillaceae bacterium]
MTVLVVAEHDNQEIKGATLNTITAAVALGAGDVEILVAGANCQSAADGAAAISGVSKIRMVDNALYANALAEPFAALV